MKYGYFNYDPVGPSIFFYMNDDGQPRETQFHIAEPERLVEAISAAIQGGHIDHVLCNETGLGLAPAIKNYLMSQFSYEDVEFELNS